MRKKERYQHIIEWFETHMPNPQTELNYENPYQLLIAVVLSAQCTDKRVNMVTPALFERFPTPLALSKGSVDEIFEYISSISYPNNKAKHLLGLGKMLVSDFNQEVPSDINDLQKLPGVGRKTANVIVSVVFDQAAMAVDTHVFRVSNRIGLTTRSKTPLQTEKTLTEYIPERLLGKAHHWLILHGRYVCTARNPQCFACGIAPYCQSYKRLTKGKQP